MSEQPNENPIVDVEAIEDEGLPAHIMIDIETLGVRLDAPIIQLGYCVFNKNRILKSTEINIEFPTTLEKADLSTVLWWMKQDKKVIEQVFNPDNRKSLYHALNSMVWEFKEREIVSVWSKGPQFDIAMLEGKFKYFHQITIPWKYFMVRDYRTIKESFPDIQDDNKKVVHSAEADAIHQARHLIKIAYTLGMDI